jgi:hypothetical protein
MLRQLAGGVPANTGGAEQGLEDAVRDSHPLVQGFCLACLGVLQRFGIAGLKRLFAYVGPFGPNLDLSSKRLEVQFLIVLALLADIEVARAWVVSLRSVATSVPQGYDGACFSLLRSWDANNDVNTFMGQAIAIALASQSVAFCCNNQDCCNIQGWSELQLPQQGQRRGKGVCGGCRAACYCSKRCQREAWPLHRMTCSSTSRAEI